MKKGVEQQNFFNGSKFIRGKRRARGTSLPSRIFRQLKDLVKALESRDDTAVSIELFKSKLIIEEKTGRKYDDEGKGQGARTTRRAFEVQSEQREAEKDSISKEP